MRNRSARRRLRKALISSREKLNSKYSKDERYSKPPKYQRSAFFKPPSIGMIPGPQSRSEAREQRENAEHRSNENSLAKSTRTIARFTIALVFVGILSAFVSGLQWHEMNGAGVQTDRLLSISRDLADAAKNSADISRAALISTQRAYVSANIDSIPVIEKDGTLKGFAFSINWQNKGPTRAINLQNFILMKRFDPDVPDNFDFAALPGKGFEGQISVNIDPNSDVHSSNWVIPLRDIELTINNTATIYLWGAAIYNDVFPETGLHHVNICVLVRVIRDIHGKENPFVYGVYKNFNKAD
jgi:hypothetical protein